MSRGLTIVTYLALLVFGMAQGLVGIFFHASGPAPLAAIAFDVVILGTCLLGGWGMRRGLGGVLPAVGWLAIVFAAASVRTGGGSVLVEASAPGEWFLFGGAVSAMAGLIAALTIWSGSRASGRQREGAGSGGRPHG